MEYSVQYVQSNRNGNVCWARTAVKYVFLEYILQYVALLYYYEFGTFTQRNQLVLLEIFNFEKTSK